MVGVTNFAAKCAPSLDKEKYHTKHLPNESKFPLECKSGPTNGHFQAAKTSIFSKLIGKKKNLCLTTVSRTYLLSKFHIM